MILYHHPSQLPPEWDDCATTLFQTRAFLLHLHTTNPCSQQYLYATANGGKKAAAVIYSLKLDIFSFSSLSLKIPIHICGIPVSTGCAGVFGDPECFSELFEQIKARHGLSLVLNIPCEYTSSFPVDSIPGAWVSGNTLPVMELQVRWKDTNAYIASLRYSYRRRITMLSRSGADLQCSRDSFDTFSEKHYHLYLEVWGKSTEKLERLTQVFFMTLSSPFSLVSFHDSDNLVAWYITLKEDNHFIFFLLGMDYSVLSSYDLYNQILFSVLKDAISCNADTIDFGQTTENAKGRFGAIPKQRLMFATHRNRLIRFLLRRFKGLLAYRVPDYNFHVFRSEA